MPLVKCPDCGKEVSDRTGMCPFCGCPLNEETLNEVQNEEKFDFEDETIDFLQDATEKAGALAKTAFNKFKEVQSYKRVGVLEIDEPNRRFKILKVANANIVGAGAKLLKGTAAISTMGLSIAAEKAIKAVTREWYSFDDIISYRVVMDNAREHSTTGSKTYWGKGISTRTRKTTSKTVTQKASIILTMNSLDEPTIEIPIITKPLGGKEFDRASLMLRNTTAALDYIIKNRSK